MIRVIVEARGRAHCLEMRGHAGFNPGNDIVCAGASAIAYALAGYLHNCGEHLDAMGRENLESGDLYLCCQGDACVAAAYEMAAIGLAQLAQRYPGHVTVEIK